MKNKYSITLHYNETGEDLTFNGDDFVFAIGADGEKENDSIVGGVGGEIQTNMLMLHYLANMIDEARLKVQCPDEYPGEKQ